jgi:hypothetical protein
MVGLVFGIAEEAGLPSVGLSVLVFVLIGVAMLSLCRAMYNQFERWARYTAFHRQHKRAVSPGDYSLTRSSKMGTRSRAIVRFQHAALAVVDVVRRERGKMAAAKAIQRVLLNRGDSLDSMASIERQSKVFSRFSMAVRGAGAKKEMLAVMKASKKAAEEAEKDDNPLSKQVRGMLTAGPSGASPKMTPVKLSMKPAPYRIGSVDDMHSIGSGRHSKKSFLRRQGSAKRGARKHFAGSGKRSLVMVRYVS